jgi:Iron-containing redox enzyme
VSLITESAPARTTGPGRPALPNDRGPISAAVLPFLRGDAAADSLRDVVPAVPTADPYGDDAQLALYVAYELHYLGFAGVDDSCEWEPELLALRRALEQRFEASLHADVAGGDDVDGEIAALLVEPVEGEGPSWFLRREGDHDQLREYLAHRSLYHLKEADPQAWAIPRLEGQAKASFVTVEHDEYGAGRGELMHAQLFADMMAENGLDPTYGAYVEHAVAATLAEVNFMSMCGLQRAHRGALVGQFALVELTSSPGSARLVAALERLGSGPASVRFYDEHVEADAVHEQVVRRGVIAPLLAAEPDLAADVVFGLQASTLLTDRLGDHLLGCWRRDRTSLRRPL